MGESGCEKTTCGRTCIGIHDKTYEQVLYKGKDVQIILKDTYGSLNLKIE